MAHVYYQTFRILPFAAICGHPAIDCDHTDDETALVGAKFELSGWILVAGLFSAFNNKQRLR